MLVTDPHSWKPSLAANPPPPLVCLDGVESSIHKGTLHGSIGIDTVTSPGHLSTQGLCSVLVRGGVRMRFRGGGGRGRRLLLSVWLRARGRNPGGVRVPTPRARRWSTPKRREGLPRAVQGGGRRLREDRAPRGRWQEALAGGDACGHAACEAHPAEALYLGAPAPLEGALHSCTSPLPCSTPADSRVKG
jgi:hypothetical protein